MTKTIQSKHPLVAKSGFYYRKAWLDKGTSAELFYHGIEKGKPVVESLGVAALESPLSTATQISWGTGTSFLQYVMQGIAQGASSIVSGSRDITNTWEQIKNFFASQNKVAAQEQSIIVGSDTTHKKYQSSYSDIAIPPVYFTFVNENDTDYYLNRCEKLLSNVLPKQEMFNVTAELRNLQNSASIPGKNNGTGPSEKQTSKYEENIKELKKVTENDQRLFYKESPPGNLKDPFMGFSLNGISGYFSLRLGYKRLYYLVPTQVRIEISRSGSIFGAKTKGPKDNTGLNGTPTNWRPHYVRVGITLERIGKIFTNDLKGNLLYCEDIKYGGAGSTKKKESENVGTTANESENNKKANGIPADTVYGPFKPLTLEDWTNGIPADTVYGPFKPLTPEDWK